MAEFLTANDTFVDYNETLYNDVDEDPIGGGFILTDGTGQVVIIGTREELRTFVGRLAALFPPATWEVDVIWGLCEHNIEVFYTEEDAIAGFYKAVEAIKEEHQRDLVVIDPNHADWNGQYFATDWDDWEVRLT